MNVWMDGWMDGWIGGWMYGWKHECIESTKSDEWMSGQRMIDRMLEWMIKWADVLDESMVVSMNKHMIHWLNECLGEFMFPSMLFKQLSPTKIGPFLGSIRAL